MLSKYELFKVVYISIPSELIFVKNFIKIFSSFILRRILYLSYNKAYLFAAAKKVSFVKFRLLNF